MPYKIFFSNLGYARGLDGSLEAFFSRGRSLIYNPPSAQAEILAQAKTLIETHNPDLCCFVEIDRGSLSSGGYNQIHGLIDQTYHFYDIDEKYGKDSYFRYFPFHQERCNGFMARKPLKFFKTHFKHGTKRLIYTLELPHNITLFFAHFSLIQHVRKRQFEDLHEQISKLQNPAIIMADFNILAGFDELDPLLSDGSMKLLNRADEHTFSFLNTNMILDLCICSKALDISLEVIPQPYSDHEALLACID